MKKHWCPKGCGKSVMWTKFHPKTGERVKAAMYCYGCLRSFKTVAHLQTQIVTEIEK